MMKRLARQACDERGIALPMAMFVLLLLTSLSIAFMTLSTTEPVIAMNHSRTAQARGFAESGLERAIWGLSHPTVTGGLTAYPADGAVAASPYNGTVFQTVTTGRGGYTVKVTAVTGTEATIEAVGWAPVNTGTTRSKRMVTATLLAIKFVAKVPQAAVAARSPMNTTGNITASTQGPQTDPSCNAATLTAVVTTGVQNMTSNGTATLQGDPGQEVQAIGTYDPYTLTDSDMSSLRALAVAAGTYRQGDQTIASWPATPANGILFFDTAAGTNISCSPACPGNTTTCAPTCSPVIPNITVSPGAGTFNGMVIINGNVTMTGSSTINGMVYVHGRFVLAGNAAGAPTINGALMSRNINGGAASNFNTTNSSFPGPTINYDCANLKNNGRTPAGWWMKSASYREPAG